jgi:glycosyltransferase involved in cell wall biosynthesis
LTGGKPEAVAYWIDYCRGKGIDNTIFTGYIHDYRRIRYYQYAADVLVSFYTHQAHDVRYNLPNKICEYMLTGNPIVSPDYPATRDLLHKDNCIFTRPEDSTDLAKHIREAIENRTESTEKAERAAREVREITFRKVTERLLRQFP